MKLIKNRFKMNLINIFLVIGTIFISNSILANNNSISFLKNGIDNIVPVTDIEWKVLVETAQISIYYVEIKDNPCMSYKLKIVNHTNTKQTISFGVAVKLADDCKGQYKDLSEFQFRKIEIGANSSIVGDENTKALLLPATTTSVKELLQNLSAE